MLYIYIYTFVYVCQLHHFFPYILIYSSFTSPVPLFRPVPPSCMECLQKSSRDSPAASSVISSPDGFHRRTQKTDPVGGPGKRDLQDPDPVDDLWVEPVPRCAEMCREKCQAKPGR